jgi:hypothetical protein
MPEKLKNTARLIRAMLNQKRRGERGGMDDRVRGCASPARLSRGCCSLLCEAVVLRGRGIVSNSCIDVRENTDFSDVSGNTCDGVELISGGGASNSTRKAWISG